MSAAEIIEMIEKLPPSEQREVRAYLEQKEKGASGDQPRTIRYISDEKFNEIVPKIFERHHELFRRLSQ